MSITKEDNNGGILVELTGGVVTQTNSKKITLTTVKSFIKTALKLDSLYIANKSNFDGMVDCVMPVLDKWFRKAVLLPPEKTQDYNLGITGAWFVRSSRDYFTFYHDEIYTGIEVYNCCGTFILAMKKTDIVS